MSDTILTFALQYSTYLMAVATFLTCLILPAPTSLVLLAAGAFAASGDLELIMIASAAFSGAVAGDQSGFAIGRWGQGWIDSIIEGQPKRRALVDSAYGFTQRWGSPGIFFSRWLVSPLGPYVNFLSGAARVNWSVFTFWSILGQAVWVAIYVGLGYLFAAQISALSEILSNLSGALAAGMVAGLLGLYLWNSMKETKA